MKAILLMFLVACSLVTQAKDLPLTGSHSVVFPTASPEGKNNAAHEAQLFAAIHAIEPVSYTHLIPHINRPASLRTNRLPIYSSREKW